MSFLPAVRQQIAVRGLRDPVRATLEYLLNNAVGRHNAVTLDSIVTHLQGAGFNMTSTGFQQSVLAASRSADYFIGSGHSGYFLIDNIGDAQEMRDFYETRIRAETQNLDNLRTQAVAVGWQI
jgi:hypothetical protein